MVIAYIEIERDPSWKGKGNINLIPKGEYWAVLHGHSSGKLDRTIFKVNTSQANIDAVKASHPDVKVYTKETQMLKRAFKIRTPTPSLAEISDFITRIKTKYGVNLEVIMNPEIGKTFADWLRDDLDHIGMGNIKCTNCNTVQPVQLTLGNCTNCGESLETHGKHNIPIWDFDQWSKKLAPIV